MTGTAERPQSSGTQTSTKVPPWLWLWIVFYVSSLPQQFSLWQKLLNDLLFYQEPSPEITGSAFFFLARLANLLEFIPLFALFLGTLSLSVPTLRKAWLERKYGLNDYEPTSIPVVVDISSFLREHAPGIIVKANPTNFNEPAFVYSLGYRKAAVAILAPLIKLWRTDRPAAEAILLHEVAHYNHGDAFIVGAGSLFREVIERWFYLFLGLFCLPIVIIFITQTITFFKELGGLGWSAFLIFPLIGAILHKIWQVIVGIPLLLISMLSILLWTANIFTIPLAGIWSSELNADQFSAQHSLDSMLNALNKQSKEPPLLTWLLNRLTHPPNWIRWWFISNSQTKTGKVLLLILFPLSYILALILQVLFAVLQAGVAGIPVESINLGGNIAYVLNNLFAPRWFIMAILLVVWSFYAYTWEQWFTKTTQRTAQLESSVYFLSAAIVGGLSLIGFMMKLVN